MTAARRMLVLVVALAVVLLVGAIVLSILRPRALRGYATAVRASTQAINRGKYLGRARDCVACHTEPEGHELAGGREMPTPFGNLYVPNIA